jgi:undecaprenyl-diphosphatase
MPWLLGWEWNGADPELRKAFDVALHAGAAAALVVVLRKELVEATSERQVLLALSVAPAALVGYALERPIERRLGTPASVALGLLGGGLLLAVSDRARRTRGRHDAGALDALWLGVAQACALIPGVSRSGATLAAARMRGFERLDAHLLSREVAVPVIAGAAALKGFRLRARRVPRQARAALAIGALASFGSTLASFPLVRLAVAERSLAPYAIYRIALAGAVLIRVRSTRSRR